MAALRILFLATADFAVPTLTAVSRGPDKALAVITRPDRPGGRGRRLRPPPAKIAAASLGLPVIQPERVSQPEGVELLRSFDPDLLFVVAFGEILSEAALATARLGAINLHASLLPRYRGAAPIQRAILAGERETGVTVQWMVREMDAGDVLLQRSLEIREDEDFGSLHDHLAELGWQVAVEALDLISKGEAPRKPQNPEEVSYAPPIRPEEMVVNWHCTASEIARKIRAFSPRPGARTGRAGRLLKLLAVREAKWGEGRGIPGRVSEITRAGFIVDAAEDRLLVLKVQPEGGRPMTAAEYARGHRLLRGEVLGAVDTLQVSQSC